MIDWFLGGGVVMWPLLACSIVALAVILERAISLRHGKVISPAISKVVEQVRGREDIAIAQAKCEAIGGPFADVIGAGLANAALPKEENVVALLASGRRAARKLERLLTVLDIVASVAPLLGLLGTVLGLNEVFNQITRHGLGDTSALSGGIAQALRTTIFGLGIAIPSLIAHTYFNRRIEDLVAEMEEYAYALLAALYRPEAVEGKIERLRHLRA
jgi:biopolymer transport protein ExbB